LFTFSICVFALEAWAVKDVQTDFPGTTAELPPSTRISYQNATDVELKALGARWEFLSAPERRALLAEVRLRMARDRGGSTRVRIQATRQFGVVRKPDGTTIRVERRIIRLIPAEQGYGTGFEQRVGQDARQPSEGAPGQTGASGQKLHATPMEATRATEEAGTKIPPTPVVPGLRVATPSSELEPAPAVPASMREPVSGEQR